MLTSSHWRLTSAAGALYSTVGAIFVAASFHDPTLGLLNRLLVPDSSPPSPAVRLYAAVMGAVVVGFGVMLARVARGAERGPSAIARALRDAVLAWFIVDTTASLLHGSWQNALFNLLSLTAGLPPILLAVRSSAPKRA
jgi:hypothetical protein